MLEFEAACLAGLRASWRMGWGTGWGGNLRVEDRVRIDWVRVAMF